MKATSRITKNTERKRVLKSLCESIASNPALCFALMLFWTWLNMAYQGPLFFPPVESAPGYLLPTWFAPIACSAIAYFALGRWFRKTNIVFKQRWYIYSVAALMTLGALLCFLWINGYGASLDSAANLVLYFLGSFGIGFGTALLMIEFGRAFGHLGPQHVLFNGIVAMLGSALFICLLALLPPFVGQMVFVLIPFPLAYCFSRSLRGFPKKTYYNHGLDAELIVPYKFLITAFIHGLSLGVLLGSMIFFGNQPFAVLLSAGSFIVAALLLLLTALFAKMDFNRLIYQVGFGIMATGAFLIACIGFYPRIGEAFQLVGFCYVHLIMWGLCAYLTKNFKLPATWVVAWPTCCLMIGQLLGGLASSTLVQSVDAEYWIRIMATAMMFVLLMASLLMLSNRNLMTGWGIARPADVVKADLSVEAVVEQLTRENNLTPRESEILALMARGRNRKFISEELVVSEETIKSHVYSMYRKLDIHSQQDLLNLVEDHLAELRGSAQPTAFE